MGILIRAIVRSFWATLFIAVVSTGFLGFIAIPWVGQQFGPLVCEPNEVVTYETYTESFGGETNTSVTYYCDDGDGEPREIPFWELLLAGGAAWYSLVFLIVWPLATLRNFTKFRNEDRLIKNGVKTPAKIVAVSETNVRVNNKPLLNITFEISPQYRSAYQLSKRMTVPHILLPHVQPGRTITVTVDPDDDQNVMISLGELAQGLGPTANQEDDSHGRVQRLEALKEMYDKRLISREEYDEKKDEILDEL